MVLFFASISIFSAIVYTYLKMSGTWPGIIKILVFIEFWQYLWITPSFLYYVQPVDTIFLAESTCEPHFAGFVKNIIKMLYKGLGQIGLHPRTHSKQNLKEHTIIEKVCSLGFLPLALTWYFAYSAMKFLRGVKQ